MFLALAFVALTPLTMVALTSGLKVAMRLCLPLALLAPTWLWLEVGAVHVDLRTIALGFLVVASVLVHGVGLPRKLLLADFLVLSLALSEMVSLKLGGYLSASTIPEVLLKWGGPYLFARLLIRSKQDARELVPYALWGLLALTALAAMECVTKVNPISTALGHAGSLASAHGNRWDFRRAEGPMKHPIFFGMALVLLLPWALEAWRLAKTGFGSRWWRTASVACLAAPVFTLSRGPILGVLTTLLVVSFLRRPRLRLPIGMLASLAVLGTYFGASDAVQMLEASAEDSVGAPVIIKGQEHIYTGTNHRLLQFLVYQEALEDAGWFGFGRFVMSNPKHADYIEPHLRMLFRSVDNHYLVTTISNGYVGLGLFAAFSVCGLYYAYRSFVLDPSGLLAPAVCGSLVALGVLMLSVWFDGDFAFFFLFNIGVAAAIRGARWEPASADPSVAFGTQSPRVVRSPGVAFPRSYRMPSSHLVPPRPHIAYGAVPSTPTGAEPPETPPAVGGTLARVWPVLLLIAVVSAPLAYLIADRFGSDRWVHEASLVLNRGKHVTPNYTPPELRELEPMLSSVSAMRRVSNELGLGLSAPDMAERFRTRLVPGSPLVKLRLEWPDKAAGEQTLNAIAERAVDRSKATRDGQLDEILAELQTEIDAIDLVVAKNREALVDFRNEADTIDIQEDRRMVAQGVRGLEMELIAVTARRKGLVAQLAMELPESTDEVEQEERKREQERQEELDRLQRKIELTQLIDRKTRSDTTQIRLRSKRQEVQRAKDLYASQLISLAELEELQTDLRLLEVENQAIGELRDWQAELDKIIIQQEFAKMQALRRKESDSKRNDEVSTTAALEGAIEACTLQTLALQERLIRDRSREEELETLLPRERELIEDLQKDLKERTSVMRQVLAIEKLKKTRGFHFTVAEPAHLASTPIASNRKKLLGGGYGLCVLALSFPVLLCDTMWQRRKKNHPLSRMGLGYLAPEEEREVLEAPTSVAASSVVDLPPMPVRKLSLRLQQFIPDENYVLSVLSTKDHPPVDLAVNLAKCFSRRRDGVLVLTVDPLAGGDTLIGSADDRTPERDGIEFVDSYSRGGGTALATRTRRGVDHRQVQSLETALETLLEGRDSYSLTIVAASLDLEDPLDVEGLAFHSDGVVFNGVGSSGADSPHLQLIEQICQGEGNVLGLIG